MSKTHVIDGVTYVEVDRKAEIGDKVMGRLTGNYYDVVDVDCKGTVFSKDECVVHQHNYTTLVKVVSCEANPSVTDLLANLARRVSSLEQQLRDTQSNVEKLAEELANTKHRVSKHATMFGIVEERVGMLTDDIITLDERSQVLNAINKFYEEGGR
jgi:hypothetical protein